MPSPSAPAAPVLATVPRVELIHVGTWNISTGTWEVTSDDLYSAVAAQGCPAVRRPVLKLGHVPGPGSPTLGTVANLAVADGGSHLVGDYVGMPAWLASTGEDGTSVLASAYPDRSVEGVHDYVCQLGHTHPFVLTAVALLGVEEPGVGTLESLASLYGVTASAAPIDHPPPAPAPPRPEETTVPQGNRRVAAQATVDDVRTAFYASPAGTGWDVWIEDMFVDPPELIVVHDGAGTLGRIPYTIATDGSVTFGDEQAVQRTYVAAAAGARPATASWASQTESRPAAHGRLTNTPTASAAGTTPTPGGRRVATFELDDEQVANLARRLGLPEGTDAETVATALGSTPASAPTPTPGADGAAPPADGNQTLTTGTPAPVDVQQGAGTTPAAPAAPTPAEDGTVRVDAAAFARLQEQAAQGVAARAQQIRESRDAYVAAAAAEGRFGLERQSYWRNYMDADEEGARALISSFPPGSVIPVAASTAGHAGTAPGAATDDTSGDYTWLAGVPHPSQHRSAD